MIEVKVQSEINQTIKERISQINQSIVPKGYKETEVGIIPDDWEVKKLGEVLQFKNGINAKKEQYGKGIKFINVLDILNNNYITYENIQDRVDIDDKTFNNNKVEYGDVLFQRSSETVEEAGTANIYLSDEPVTFGGFVIRGKKIGEFLPIYFNYMLKSSVYRQQVQRMAAGSTRYNIGQESLQGVYYCAPSLNEQQKIAAILSTWDRAIELKESLIKEKEEQKKGLKESLLTPNGSKNWEYFTLGEIGEFRTSSVNKKDNPNEEPVKLLNYMDVYNNKEIDQKIDYMRTTATDHQVKTNNVQIGDVFFTPSSETRDDIGHSAVVTEEIKSLVYSYHLIRFRINAKIDFDKKFRAYCFNSNLILREMSRLATGSTRYTLSIKDFESIGFYLPPLHEQQRISKILSTADKEINLLKQEVEQLKEQKKGLMQLLLTGIVRVKEEVTSG